MTFLPLMSYIIILLSGKKNAGHKKNSKLTLNSKH